MKWSIIICLFFFSPFADPSSIEFINANNQFASTAYKEIQKSQKGNFLVSPFSVETVLAFAESGCKGETAREIRNALHLPDDNVKIESEIKTLLPQIKGDEHYTLHTANKMYVQDNFTIKEEFRKTAKEVYQAESENIDFIKKTEAAETINSWVEKQTNNKIRNLIDPQKITNHTRAILLNVLYLNADWEHPFPVSYTHKGNFYKTANDVVKVDTMYHMAVPAFHQVVFEYYECPHLNAKFLKMPFKGGDISMTFILPNEKEGLSALENQIEKALLPHNLTVEYVDIRLPKFKIETEIDFKQILKNLGVVSAFDKEQADLSGMAGDKGDLIISEIIQKTFIDVNEKGVEAAAATYDITAIPISGFARPPKTFIADHPFLFYIKIEDIITFIGRVTDPSK